MGIVAAETRSSRFSNWNILRFGITSLQYVISLAGSFFIALFLSQITSGKNWAFVTGQPTLEDNPYPAFVLGVFNGPALFVIPVCVFTYLFVSEARSVSPADQSKVLIGLHVFTWLVGCALWLSCSFLISKLELFYLTTPLSVSTDKLVVSLLSFGIHIVSSAIILVWIVWILFNKRSDKSMPQPSQG